MCPCHPEEHGTERPLQNRFALLVAGFEEAARFLGGQTVSPTMASLTRCRNLAQLFFELRNVFVAWRKPPRSGGLLSDGSLCHT
jgi:hypothetical protein